MPIDEAALMAAVDTGIAEASASPAPATTPEPAGDDDAPASTPSPDQPAPDADGAGDAAGKEGAQADDGSDAPADGVADGGDGVPADGDGTVVDPAAKAADPAAPGEPEKAKDPLNDPLPNALKKETKERIQSLVGMVKEHSTKLQEVTRDRDDILNAVIETRATPEQYGQALSYLKLVNSPNRADREQALQFMQNEIAALARMLGKPVPGVNMLEGHDDLISEVSTGRLSPERAQEIAASRNAAQIELQQGQRAQQQNSEQQRQLAETRAGVKALNDLEAQLKAANPTVYAAKRQVLIESLKPVFKQIHPSQWAATFQRAYNALPAPVRPSAPAAPLTPRPGSGPDGGGNTPLRASNPAGAARPAPASLLEAVSQGISEAR